ncbi:MAG: alpha-L-fucosidase [Calditrichaeota bacterium]|nr:alpha-L-fucosidase [Calditrichota bacterium]
MLKYYLIFTLIFLLQSCASKEPADIIPDQVIPSQQQIAYQKMEMIGFVHFTVNTYTDKEWGYGDESPSIFNPVKLDASQWAKAAKVAGLKQLILTAKHHDGFCLWPSAYTEHSVKNSPWKEGKGDVVREFVDACRINGLKAGLYLSPWDRNHASYGRKEYINYYRNQLRELLTNYGTISEIWFDGANGGDGYYGGANEERRIDRKTYYNWPETWSFVKDLQPDILIFSDAGPDIRWIGNENGFAGETNWSKLDPQKVTVGGADTGYLNRGDSLGSKWVVGECDVSIRPGWFYHQHEDSMVKSLKQLLEIYYKSVGRNGVMLLNIPPTPEGLFHENDIKALKNLRQVLDETFTTNLASGKEVTASNTRLNHSKFAAQNIVDDSTESYWAPDDGITNASLEIDLGEPQVFDRIVLQEPIRFGQRVAAFSIQIMQNDKWVNLARGTTIGYKRIMRTPVTKTSKIRLFIEKSMNIPAISNFAIYKASPKENL